MDRRDFMMYGGSWIAPLSASAQNAAVKEYRIGSLNSAGPADKGPYGPLLIRSLAQHGYVLDKNITFVHYGAEMQLNRLPQLVDELQASKVDVVFALGYPAALAMKRAAIPVSYHTQPAIRLAPAWSRVWRDRAATSPASPMCRRK